MNERGCAKWADMIKECETSLPGVSVGGGTA